MKNLMKNAFVAMSVSMFAVPAFAGNNLSVEGPVRDTVVKHDTVVRKDDAAPMLLVVDDVVYTDIEVSEVPDAVNSGLAEKYAGYELVAAAKGSDNSYRLTISREGHNLKVYFTESGEFLSEESEVPVQV